MKLSTVWDFKMWPLAVLTRESINVFFYEEMYGRFAGPKKKWPQQRGDCITEVAVRRGSTVVESAIYIT